MHDLIVAAAFIVIMLLPCVIATFAGEAKA